MRPGARGGWVNGSLTWNGLDSWHAQSGEYRTDQIAVLRELRATQQAGEGRMTYYYSYSGEKALDLSDCSAQLWPLLDEALRLGVTLIHTRATLGEVPLDEGEVVLDVTRDDGGGALVEAVLRVGDDTGRRPRAAALPRARRARARLLRAGRRPRSEEPALRLVRLARPAPLRLQKLLLDRERLTIPASDLERFADEISPALRGVATVISSDGSFTPPEVSAPELVLHATYGDDHRVEVAWEWVYTVGDDAASHPARGERAGIPRPRRRARDPPRHPDRRDRPGAVRPRRRRRAARGHGRDAHRPRQPAPDDRGAAAPRRARRDSPSR